MENEGTYNAFGALHNELENKLKDVYSRIQALEDSLKEICRNINYRLLECEKRTGILPNYDKKSEK